MARLSRIALLAAVAAALAPGTASARLLDPAALPFRPAAEPPTGHLVAAVEPGRSVVLRARPFGPILARLDARTEFGSPRTLSVVRSRRERWLAVTAPELANSRLGWVDARAGGLRFERTRLELDVDLSRRLLSVRSGGHVLRSATVGIGRPGSPTPTGRFAVTDELDGAAYSPAYGCCILALSGRQTNLPAGWRGGDRLAIHGGSTAGAVSAGCIHASDADLRYLMRLVPLGTPVVVHA